MKSLIISSFLSLLMLGCGNPVSGHSVRNDGPFRAYERNVKIDLNACEEVWKKDLPNTASCDVVVDAESFNWFAGRIIQHWEYDDSGWLVDISIYHTAQGYRISMLGRGVETEEYFKFEIARKYIESALQDWSRENLYQILLRPKTIGKRPGEESLGSVNIVDRKIFLRSEELLQACSRTWKSGRCYIDVVHGSGRDALLEIQRVDFQKENIYLESTGFEAWRSGSGLSDYKFFMGSNSSKTSFNQFKKDWLAHAPYLTVNLRIQKFSFHPSPSYAEEEFLSFARVEKYKFNPDSEICKSSFKIITEYKAECFYDLPSNSYSLANLNILTGVISYQNRYATVWVRSTQRKLEVAVSGHSLETDYFKVFWQILQSALEQRKPRNLYLLTIGHQ